MKWKRFFSCLLCGVLLLCGCTPAVNSATTSHQLELVTTLFCYYDFARAILKDTDTIHLRLLLSPGMESHSFEPAPSDILAIQNADLFLYNGGHMEEWVAQVLDSDEQSHPDRIVRCMMDYAPLLEEVELEGSESEHDHEHDHDDHDHDESCGCHDHDHHHDLHEHDHEHHEHEHHHHDHDHDHGESCTCGCHDHDHDHEHHHHHHADEVFTSWGMETAKTYTAEEIQTALEQLEDAEKYGMILRAKGIVAGADGKWIHFDYVPGTPDVRTGSASTTGRLCVIGSHIQEDALAALFRTC